MKAARWHGRRDIRIEEVSPRDPRPRRSARAGGLRGHLRDGPVRIHARSAVHRHGATSLTGRCAPVTMGHEFTGTITDAGAGVKDLRAGERIVAEASLPCGACLHCQKGEFILCRQAAYLGFAWDGAFADTCTLPASVCHKVPDKLSSEDAVLIEPLASAMHAVRRGRILPGETAAIVGGGTIGLSTLLCARAAGASRVFVVERIPRKRKLALELGAEMALDPADGDAALKIAEATGGGVGVSFECVGSSRTVNLAVRSTRIHGRTVVVGVMVEPQPFSFLDTLLHEREIIGTAGYFGEFPMCMALVADGRINARPLISATIGLDDIVSRGFEPFASPDNTNIKIVVRPR